VDGDLALGSAVVAGAALLAGVTGFGFGILATPLLLALGFPLEFVVTANLAIASVTRVGTAFRMRSHVVWPRAAALAGGSMPGLALGAVVLARADTGLLARAAGALAAAAALVLLLRRRGPRRPPRGATFGAGFAGGFLGTTTSMNGIPPALLLGRERVTAPTFLADLAVYFVAVNALGLVALAVAGSIDADALFPATLVWLPGSIAGNLAGTAVGPRLPADVFRALTLGLVLASGIAVAVSG